MHDENQIFKVDNVPIEKLIVYSPEQCPFRFTARYYDGNEDYCSYLKSLHKKVIETFTMRDHTFSMEKEDECCCFDELWIEGCPLLSNSFTVEKN